MKRPSNRLSSIAALEATTTGWLCGRLTTAVPTLICLVAPSSVAMNIMLLGMFSTCVGQMLAAIAFAVAEPVGEDERLAVLLQRFGVVPALRMDRHGEKAELHATLR